MAFDGELYTPRITAEAQAVCARDMALDDQHGSEPWTRADEALAEQRDHFVDSARDYRREYRL